MRNKVDLSEDEILSTADSVSTTSPESSPSSQDHCEWLLEEAQRVCDSGDSLLCDELAYQYAEQCVLPLEKAGILLILFFCHFVTVNHDKTT